MRFTYVGTFLIRQQGPDFTVFLTMTLCDVETPSAKKHFHPATRLTEIEEVMGGNVGGEAHERQMILPMCHYHKERL